MEERNRLSFYFRTKLQAHRSESESIVLEYPNEFRKNCTETADK